MTIQTPDAPAPPKRHSAVADFLRLFLNPLVLILPIAAAQKAIKQLQQSVATTATIMRDGKRQEIRRINVVPYDLVRLSAGDLIPADARLLESRDLYIQDIELPCPWRQGD